MPRKPGEGQFSFDLGLDGAALNPPLPAESAAAPSPGPPEPAPDVGSTGDLNRPRLAPGPGPESSSVLVRALARVSADYPVRRKVIVCRTGGEGRELLRQLAVRTGSWVGFEATTPRRLAIAVAGPGLAARGVRLTDAFDEEALLDEAIDEVLLEGGEDEHARLARGVGMRRALAHAVKSLRVAGVGTRRLRDAPLADAGKTRVLAGILRAYEARLRARALTDTAGVYRAAIEALGGRSRAPSAASLQGRRLYLVPGIGRRGLGGRFLRALQGQGAEVLETDAVAGLAAPESLVWRGARTAANRLAWLYDVEHAPEGEAPREEGSLDIFVANSLTAELREVLRRVVERGLSWDEVEIVATDPDAYGSALHAVAEHLAVPVTYAGGLPVERTRPGRVATAYFRWIEGGFDAGVVRTLLYAGDLTAPRPNHWIRGPTLARQLRNLRIGWGRERYLRAIGRQLSEVDGYKAGRYETPEQLERRKARTRGELQALGDLLAPALRATPPVSIESDPDAAPVSPSQVARGLRRFLKHTSPGSSVDDTALQRMERILERVEATLTRRTDYRAASAIVRRHLSFPVPAPRAEGSAPWSSTGGALYLCDVESGGRTGRRATFIVGLDAHRLSSSATQDPYLLDGDRRRLAGPELPLSTDRVRERRFLLAALFARLRGSVCLSYSAWDPSEARAVSPSAELLQAFRLMRANPAATFEDLDEYAGERAGLVPRRTGRLDSTDVWMASLEREGRLLEGEQGVREAFPRIRDGLRARDALRGDRVTAHHGMIAPRPELDPRRDPGRAVSASALGAIGACARRYFYSHVLRIRPPDDHAYDPESWLDALNRGSVLHEVYERSLLAARQQEVAYDAPEFEHLVKRILREAISDATREIPAPSDVVRARQEHDMARDVDSFIAMVREDEPDWIDTELRFGLGGEEAVPFPTSSGPVSVRGAIDRLDRIPEGLRVVDYKTGSTYRYGGKTGTWEGGRRLQHVIYAGVASLLHAADTAVMEYHFPTRKGENRRVSYTARDLVSGPELVSRLLDLVAKGLFLPTDTDNDCRFCDYQAVCRVRATDFSTNSPLAKWVKERIGDLPELAGLRAIRNWDEEGDGFLLALEAQLAGRGGPA